MPRKRLLAPFAVTAALAAGGAAGYLMGVPGVSGAQTTDTPATTVPSTTDERDDPVPPGRNDNCPEKGARGDAETPGPAPEGSSSRANGTGTAIRRGGGRLL